jgi:membrane associated rhomboid family serine protease
MSAAKIAEDATAAANAAAKAGVQAAADEIERLPSQLAAKLRPYSPTAAYVVAAIDIDAPLTFVLAFSCVLVHTLNWVLGGDGWLSRTLFAVPPMSMFSFFNPLSYWRLFSHVLGHGSWTHLHGNLVNMLLVAPNCEREYGVFNLFKIMMWTALSSGLAHMLFGSSNAYQLGASGIVFMLILLNSLVEARHGRVPLTFICQVRGGVRVRCGWLWVKLGDVAIECVGAIAAPRPTSYSST